MKKEHCNKDDIIVSRDAMDPIEENDEFDYEDDDDIAIEDLVYDDFDDSSDFLSDENLSDLSLMGDFEDDGSISDDDYDNEAFINGLPISDLSKEMLIHENILAPEQLVRTGKMRLRHIVFRDDYDKLLEVISDLKDVVEAQSADIKADIVEEGPSYTFLEGIFDDYSEQERRIAGFRKNDGLLYQDIAIEDLNCSTRLYNALKRNKLDTILKVINEKSDVIYGIPNLGQKSLNELIDIIRSHIVFVKDQIQENVDDTCTLLIHSNDEIYKEFITFYNSFWSLEVLAFIERPLKDFIARNLEETSTYVSDIVSYKREIDDLLKRDEGISRAYQDRIFTILVDDVNLEIEDFLKQIPEIYVGAVSEALSTLAEDGKIERVGRQYRITRPTLNEWLETIDIKRRIILQAKLEGKTLEECGKLLSVTRERVRQMLVKVISKRPRLREDDYGKWFEKYYYEDEQACEILDITDRTLQYLKLAYKKGSQNLEEMRDDPELTEELSRRLENYFRKKMVVYDGVYYEPKRENILRAVTRKICSDKSITVSELYDECEKVIEHINMNNGSSLSMPSLRAFDAYVAKSEFLVCAYNNLVRYYPISEYDIRYLVNEFDLKRYMDKEISAFLLFTEHRSLMKEYDILSEYELHDILKKTKEDWDPEGKSQVTFHRMPNIVIGTADRRTQAIELLQQIAPISLDEYAEYYEMLYGTRSNTVKANFTGILNEFYHNGELRIDQPILNEEDEKKLKESLTEDFYKIEEVERIAKELLAEKDTKYINARTYKRLHFRVYSGYILREEYMTAEGYFRSLFLSMGNINIDTDLERYHGNHSAQQTLAGLEYEYEMLEYEEHRVISFEKLKIGAPEVTKQMLMEYVDSVLDTMEDGFFTITSVRKKGHESELYDLGFGDHFYASLIRFSNKINYLRFAGTYVFYRANTEAYRWDLISYILRDKYKMDIYDLLDMLSNDYGINVTRESLLWVVSLSDELYYDRIMEKVYIDKEEYYNEF